MPHSARHPKWRSLTLKKVLTLIARHEARPSSAPASPQTPSIFDLAVKRSLHKPRSPPKESFLSNHCRIIIGTKHLEGELCTVEPARGLVVFAHGSGSSRTSPRNLHVAQTLQRRGLSTLLFDPADTR